LGAENSEEDRKREFDIEEEEVSAVTKRRRRSGV
jgi:hypothetical protein